MHNWLMPIGFVVLVCVLTALLVGASCIQRTNVLQQQAVRELETKPVTKYAVSDQDAVKVLVRMLQRERFSIPNDWSPLNDIGPQPSGATFAHNGVFRESFKASFLEVPRGDADAFRYYWPYCWNEGYGGYKLRFGDKVIARIKYSTPEWEAKYRRILAEWGNHFKRRVEIIKDVK